MRARLPNGTHVPHPRIAQRMGRRIEISATRTLPLEVDGARRAPARTLTIEVVPAAYRVLA